MNGDMMKKDPQVLKVVIPTVAQLLSLSLRHRPWRISAIRMTSNLPLTTIPMVTF